MAVHGKGEAERELLRGDPLFQLDTGRDEVPRFHLPNDPMPAEAAHRLIHQELMLDGNASLNLATFVTTWMEPEADRLMLDCAARNMIDKDEYPQTAEIETRCVNILGNLWHMPEKGGATGCSTTGSSEACMLGGLALKRRWRAGRRAEGKDTTNPNIVMGANVQVCWEKFANYFEVEPRLVPIEGDRYHLGASEAIDACDENTIGVVAILGSTFDGSYEPVADIAAGLDDLETRTGMDIPVHVDGASGAMIAPFLDEEVVWDFRLPRVASINVSGHKYGRVYPGVGWIVWRDAAALPEELVFRVNYLGGDMPTFGLNFSRPGSQVVAQYYNFLRLGWDGFRAVQRGCRDVAMFLSAEIAATGRFDLLSDGSQLPVFAFTTKPGTAFDVFDLSAHLRARGWQVPAYTFPDNRTDLAAARVVVRQGSKDAAELFLDDLRRGVEALDRTGGGVGEHQSSFHH
ncbi:MAG TPA: glutamate decarboxylase [Acidimicrobiales bacterium]|jgi:glutamate decarboxylase|nr:glutamate decarboxylase [Acidimicrobiales bacterium]